VSKYLTEIDDAYELLEEAGVGIVFTRPNRTINPVSGLVTAKAPATTTLVGVNLPASKGTVQAFDNRILDKTVLTKLRFLICAAKGAAFEPESGDLVALEGKTWEVVGVTPLAPDGTPILYKLGCKLTIESSLP
jgi:nitrite reductase/ring-hydroxylating ferredoxin subunit